MYAGSSYEFVVENDASKGVFINFRQLAGAK